MRKIIAISIAILLFSCSHKADEKRATVLALEGTEIMLPDSLAFEVQGVPVTISKANHDFRIITYIDAEDCTPCKMRLSDWNQLIDKYKRTDQTDVDFLMIVNAQSTPELDSIVRAENFRNPICFDSARRFNQSNQIPARYIFQTFLLDSDNRILLIGNPTINPQIEDLYDSVIYEDNTAVFSRFCGAPTECFGTATIGDTISANFVLHNSTDRTLTIRKIITSCNCVTAVASADTIAPATDAVVTVTVVADSPGETKKYADIYFYEQQHPERLTLYGFTLINPNH